MEFPPPPPAAPAPIAIAPHWELGGNPPVPEIVEPVRGGTISGTHSFGPELTARLNGEPAPSATTTLRPRESWDDVDTTNPQIFSEAEQIVMLTHDLILLHREVEIGREANKFLTEELNGFTERCALQQEHLAGLLDQTIKATEDRAASGELGFSTPAEAMV